MDKPRHRRLFFLVAAVLLYALPRAAESLASASPGDAAALRALSKALGADKALNWSESADPCQWPRVQCSSGGRVSRIQIGNHDLSGTLPPELGNLTALEILELQSNRISGPLPSLAGFSVLQRLFLHSNLFTSIPAGFFSGLTAVQNVSLDDNTFAPWTIPDDLRDASSLVSFSANSANVAGPIPDFLGDSFPGINHIGLAGNLLEGGIPPSFARSTVQYLWLNGQRSSFGLTGGIGVVGNMTSLVQIWLNLNNFTGPLPDFSALTNLKDLRLRDNQLTGIVPKSLTSLKSLTNVSLTNNLLQGTVPTFATSVNLDFDPSTERFCRLDAGDCDPRVNVLLSIAKSFGYPSNLADKWSGNDPCGGWLGISCNPSGNITVVNLPNKGLSGTISPDFASFPFLQKLLLSNNNITGTIPSTLVGLKFLAALDVSNNSLWGAVPSFSSNVLVNTDGNPNIGKDAPPPPGSPNSGGGSNSSGGTSSGKPSLSIVVVGSVIGGICVVFLIGLLCFCYCKRVQRLFGKYENANTTVIHPRHSGSGPDLVKISLASGLNGGIGSGSETYSLPSSGPSDLHVVESRNLMISIQVLRNVTDNFSDNNILGRGGFGTVYWGKLDDGTQIAVKRMESGVMGSKGLDEFKSEIAVLTKVRHRHLVSLLGYCLDGNEKILVYQYMPQGTLSDHLFNWMQAGLTPLEWKRRLSISLDVARGVEYLHSMAHQSFIHRDLKPSNILLGDDMKAKVADFGLVRLAPDGKNCSIQTRLAGTFGYLAPEYAVTGRVTTKADVYSFGVILMELITGRRALDESQAEECVHLVTWFRRMLINKETFPTAVDPVIKLDDETLSSIRTVAELAGHCCAREPHQRPDMGHAVNTLSSLAELWKPADSMEESYGIDLEMSLPQALKKWQEFGDSSQLDNSASSVLSRDNTQSSIPTRPAGFADSFTSADAR